MRRLRTLLLLATVVCGLSLVFASAAMAAGEYELNDSREAAFGPLVGGTEYTATLETDNDVDWYVFYVKAYSQMDFSATSLKADECNAPYLHLRDKDGKSVESFRAGSVNVTNHLRVTLNPGRYYFEVNWPYCAGDRYRFRIDPAAAITPSRECGEAIVARDSITPELAKVAEAMAENGEDLVKATAVVKAAARTFNRLKKRRRASGYRKRQARRRLEAAKNARKKVLQEKAGLQALAAQQQGTLTQAEGQIALYC